MASSCCDPTTIRPSPLLNQLQNITAFISRSAYQGRTKRTISSKDICCVGNGLSSTDQRKCHLPKGVLGDSIDSWHRHSVAMVDDHLLLLPGRPHAVVHQLQERVRSNPSRSSSWVDQKSIPLLTPLTAKYWPFTVLLWKVGKLKECCFDGLDVSSSGLISVAVS